MYRFSTSQTPAEFSASQPHFLPLDGLSKRQAADLLRRKGALLAPPLAVDEAVQLVQYMRLERFAAESMISFDAQSPEQGRLMLVLAGEVSMRLRDLGQSRSQHSPLDQASRWATATEGATLGLVHAFAGSSGRFVAQATTELFVASLTREAMQLLKGHHPTLALRLMEMLAMELAFVALEYERKLHAMNNVARSMQSLIDTETATTRPGALD